MTQEFLQDAIVDELTALFSTSFLQSPDGNAKPVEVFPQNLPIKLDEDEPDPQAYITVRLLGGTTATEQDPETVKVVLVICVYDEKPDRQGYRDALHIKNQIYRHFAVKGTVGGKFQLTYPLEWENQSDDTHPYYFMGIGLSFLVPMIQKEGEI